MTSASQSRRRHSIVLGTAVLVVSGLVVGLFTNKENRTYVKEKETR